MCPYIPITTTLDSRYLESDRATQSLQILFNKQNEHDKNIIFILGTIFFIIMVLIYVTYIINITNYHV